jgi:hypothetical protein
MSAPVSSGIRFYDNIVAKLHRESLAREQAWANDEWLAHVREQQGSQPRAREQSVQKIQSCA